MKYKKITDRYVFDYLKNHKKTLWELSYKQSIYNLFVKRIFDFFLALFLSILLMPIFIVIAAIVKVTSPGPIFYRGVRGAYGGGTFRLFKFRSMVINAEELGGGTTALNDPRVTKVGSFLRKTKLDETPQVFNIILGDMSFVGPRPELPQYTQAYHGAEKLILQVRPGITDISSLTFISLDEIVGDDNADEVYERLVLKRKNLLRIGYVIFQSPALDFQLLFLTAFRVIQRILKIIFCAKNK